MIAEFALDVPSNVAVPRVTQALNATGFRVEQSFDLRSAMTLVPSCSCPHHGTASCDCQYVVLLVYENKEVPAALIVHGHDDRSWVMLADNPKRGPSVSLREAILKTLSPMVSFG